MCKNLQKKNLHLQPLHSVFVWYNLNESGELTKFEGELKQNLN